MTSQTNLPFIMEENIKRSSQNTLCLTCFKMPIFETNDCLLIHPNYLKKFVLHEILKQCVFILNQTKMDFQILMYLRR